MLVSPRPTNHDDVDPPSLRVRRKVKASVKANGTALSLMGSTLTTSVLGVLFWAVAVHLYSAGQIGIDSALVSTMMTIATVCQLNLNNVIV